MTYPCTKQTTLWKPTMQIHAWMSEGYETLHKAKQMGWPVPMWQSELPPTYVPTALTYPLMAQLPVIHCIPPEPLFMTGGSWHPHGRCGGCIAIVCTHTYQYTLYPVAIPISLDQSYAVELYVAWILSRVRTSLQFTDHDNGVSEGRPTQIPGHTFKLCKHKMKQLLRLSTDFCRYPDTLVGTGSVAFVDTPNPIRLQGCFTGVMYW